MNKVIMFDLDGTLTDPKPGITRSVQYALAKLGIVVDDADSLSEFIGPPLSESFQELYGLSDAEIQVAIRHYRDRFAAVGLYENAVYPGIPELLTDLTEQKRTLVVATSKPTVFSEKILAHFSLARFFTFVAGSNLDGTRVDKGEVIRFALTEIKTATASHTIMVGDRKHDILGAKKNDLPVVAVGYGYGSRQELTAAQPDCIAWTVEELRRCLGV